MILRALGFSAALATAFLAGTMMPTGEAQQRSHFLRIDYMRIPPGQALRYRSLEVDVWKPVHQARVDKGYITSWRLYGHHFPGGNDDYQYVTVTEFPSLQAMDELHYPELFQEVHSKDYDTEISPQTVTSRELTHTDIWALLDSVTQPQQ
ncbi:MAG: hypothetical protein OXN89_04465 [Bryobacterales bacterium]|nr:hypothetical protein [Bryobacterales bacterium]